MTSKLKLVEKYIKTLQPSPKVTVGFLGNLDGTVATGVPGYVYVLLWSGEVIEAFNVSAPSSPGLPVKVITKDNENFVEIWDVYPEKNQAMASHAKWHSWPYPDYVSVQGQQFIPGLCVPQGMVVHVYGGMLRLETVGYALVKPAELDLTSEIPETGALWAVVGLNEDGTVSVETGGEADSYAELLLSEAPHHSGFGLALIKLYSGQNAINQTASQDSTELLDLRFFAVATSGGSGGGTWGSITGTLSEQTDLQSALDDKVEDAPEDGKEYVRKDADWEELVFPYETEVDLSDQIDGSTDEFTLPSESEITDVYLNGQRLISTQYEVVDTTLTLDFVPEVGDTLIVKSAPESVSVVGLADAPSDGKQYARKDADWEEVAAPSGDLLSEIAEVMATNNSTECDEILESGDMVVLIFFSSHNSSGWKSGSSYTVPTGKKLITISCTPSHVASDTTYRGVRFYNVTGSSELIAKDKFGNGSFSTWEGDLATTSAFTQAAAGTEVRLEIYNADGNKRACGAYLICRLVDA